MQRANVLSPLFYGVMIGIVCSAGALFTACSNVAAPAEQQEQVTLSRELEFTPVDSHRMTATEVVDAGTLNTLFNSVKERITRIGCTPPVLTVTAYAGDSSSVIDTLFLYIGPQTTGAMDTLTGPTFLTSTQLVSGERQMVWVNSATLQETQQLLAHAPYGFVVHGYVHSTKLISAVRINLEFPVDVSYLK